MIKQGGTPVQKVTKSIRIDTDLWRRARAKGLAEGKTMQQLIEHLLRRYLGEGGK
jgi:uncharacterized protein (DUF4415 family)